MLGGARIYSYHNYIITMKLSQLQLVYKIKNTLYVQLKTYVKSRVCPHAIVTVVY